MSNKNDLNPLMFIDTVNTKITKNSSQQIFDSRYSKKQINNNNINYQTIKNIITLYNHNQPITCQITLVNQETIIGIPYYSDNKILKIKNEENDFDICININSIIELIILKV